MLPPGCTPQHHIQVTDAGPLSIWDQHYASRLHVHPPRRRLAITCHDERELLHPRLVLRCLRSRRQPKSGGRKGRSKRGGRCTCSCPCAAASPALRLLSNYHRFRVHSRCGRRLAPLRRASACPSLCRLWRRPPCAAAGDGGPRRRLRPPPREMPPPTPLVPVARRREMVQTSKH